MAKSAKIRALSRTLTAFLIIAIAVALASGLLLMVPTNLLPVIAGLALMGFFMYLLYSFYLVQEQHKDREKSSKNI